MRSAGRFLLFSLCILSASANAGEWSGYGELQSGGGLYDSRLSTSGTAAQGFVAGSGHLQWNFAPGLNLQIDGEGRADRIGGRHYVEAASKSSYGLGAHFDVIDPQYRFGVVASIGKVDNSPFGKGMFSASIEGAWFLERTTAIAQLIYSEPLKQQYAGADAHSVYLQTGARHFLHDNLMLEAGAGAGLIAMQPRIFTRPGFEGGSPPPVYLIAWGGRNGFSSGDMLRWSLGGEYRLDNWPLSIGLGYRGSYGSWRHLDGVWFRFNTGEITSCDANLSYRRTEHLFAVRLRYYFGQDSLIANDRTGAGANDYNPWYGAEPVLDPSSGAATPAPAC